MEAGDLNRALQYYKVGSRNNQFSLCAYVMEYHMVWLRDVCSSHSISWYFQEAVKLKPNFSDAYLNLGNVYKVRYMCLVSVVG